MRLINVVVLIADGNLDRSGVAHSIDKVKFACRYVRITDDFNKDMLLGEAKLRIDGNKVKADLNLNLELHPNMRAKLKPCVGGTVSIDGEFTINEVALSKENTDARIKSLGEQCIENAELL